MSGLQPAPRRDRPAPEADSRAAFAAAASFLAQGRLIGRLSQLLTAGAILLLVALAIFTPTLPIATAIALAAAAALGLAERYFAFRVGFDAALFERLAGDPTAGLADLDRALSDLGLLPPGKAGRSFAIRFAGARKLLFRQAIAAILQVLCLIGAAAAAL